MIRPSLFRPQRTQRHAEEALTAEPPITRTTREPATSNRLLATDYRLPSKLTRRRRGQMNSREGAEEAKM